MQPKMEDCQSRERGAFTIIEAMTSVLQDWIGHIFSHPVAEPAWCCAEDAEEWTGRREEIPLLIAETFERSGELLATYSDEQLDQGFWYLICPTKSEFMETLIDKTIPLEARLRALNSVQPLFEQVMAIRCTDHLGHTACEGAGPLNGSCYMWWDHLRFRQFWVEQSDIAPAILAIMPRLLAIPHDACRESALHGIGHIRHDRPEHHDLFTAIIDDFLTQTPGLRPELVAYAEKAKAGEVL